MPRKPPLPTADDFFRVAPRQAEAEAAAEQEPAPVTEPAPKAEAEAVAESPPAVSPKKPTRRTRKPRAERPVSTPPTEIAAPADPAADALEKVTFYLPRSLLKSLELVRVRVLMDHDAKINRSQIAEAVIAAALTDLGALERLVLERIAQGEKG